MSFQSTICVLDSQIFSETNSLAFMLFRDKGMVYLHGSGEVIYKDGKRIVLPSLEKGEAD